MSRPRGLPKTGGRKRGIPNKTTAKKEAAIKASGLTPLEFMLGILRSDAPADLRFEAAKAAAPYVHPRLQAMTLGSDPDKPLKVESMSELEVARRLAFILTSGAPSVA